jgi:DNA-binding transcriptional MerR regulator
MYRTNADDSHANDSKSLTENLEFAAVSRDTDRITIGELARDAGVTLRALRFYQSKGLLSPQRSGTSRIFSPEDRARLALIQQGKRLGFTLGEIREMLQMRRRQSSGDRSDRLPISRKKCVEQIKHVENQRRILELALIELRQIYTGMSIALESALTTAAVVKVA